jgi:hypothetical protein
MDVLWEMPCKHNKRAWSGLTDNYIRVITRNEANLVNTITSTKLVGLVEGGMWGEVDQHV